MEELNTGVQATGAEQEAAALEAAEAAEPQYAAEEQPTEVTAAEILGLTRDEGTTDEPEEQPTEETPPENKVEIAFGKRLAHEKSKIERKYAPIIESVKELFGIEGDDLSAIEKALVEKRVKDAAEKYGIDEGLARDIYGKQAAPDPQPLPHETIDRLSAEEAAVKSEFPDFNLVEALEAHPRYMALVVEGDISVAQFNALINPQAAEKQKLAAEAKITDNIKKRQEKPKPQDPRNKGIPKIDIQSLTREQLDEIAERVRYGERVLLE
jgi:hypothetical protein